MNVIATKTKSIKLYMYFFICMTPELNIELSARLRLLEAEATSIPFAEYKGVKRSERRA